MAKKSADKGRELLQSKTKFPDFNLLDYDNSLRANLSFYNVEVDDNKKKKEWTLAYWKDQKKDTKGLARMSDAYFVTVGALAHMVKFRNIALNENDISHLDKKYEELKGRVNVETSEDDAVDTSADRARHREALADSVVKDHIGEFLHGVDLFLKGDSFDAKGYLVRNNVKAVHTRRIADALKPTLREIKLAIAGKDEQLVEAYSFFSMRKLNKFAEYVQGLIDSCEVAAAITKAARSPRATKVKSPSEVVKAVKWLESDSVSKLKSEHPSKIVNASEAWVYNAKNRRLFKYVSLGGLYLTVKGSTIINVDVEKSGGKIVRKPETLLKGIQDMTSRPINKLYSSIRGTESRATGRLSEDILIVKCFNN